jgi:hypothetical protein
MVELKCAMCGKVLGECDVQSDDHLVCDLHTEDEARAFFGLVDTTPTDEDRTQSILDELQRIANQLRDMQEVQTEMQIVQDQLIQDTQALQSTIQEDINPPGDTIVHPGG